MTLIDDVSTGVATRARFSRDVMGVGKVSEKSLRSRRNAPRAYAPGEGSGSEMRTLALSLSLEGAVALSVRRNNALGRKGRR